MKNLDTKNPSSLDRLKTLLKEGYVEPPLIFPIVGYHVAHINKIDFRSYLIDWERTPILQFQALRDYGSDFVALVMDLTLEAEALGAKVSYHATPPSIEKHLSFTEDNINKLYEVEDKYISLGRLHIVLKGLTKLIELNNRDLITCAYVTGPLTLASNLFGPEVILKSFIKDQDKLIKVLEATTNLQLKYLEVLVEIGVDSIAVLEPTASLISPQMYDRFLLNPLRKIFGKIRQKNLVGILHTCGRAEKIVKNMGYTEAHILSLDFYVDLAEAIRITNKIVMGNVPTTYFLESSNKVYKYTIQLLDRTKSFKHIVSSGCEIPAYATPETVKELKLATIDWYEKNKRR